MAKFTMLDTEFRKLSPTFVSKGGNPVPPPEGATVEYETDDGSLLQLSKTPPGNHPELPVLSDDGLQGVYVGSGGIGATMVRAIPKGTIEHWENEEHEVEILGTEPDQLNTTFGDPIAETPTV
jgi:hypothetical protein